MVFRVYYVSVWTYDEPFRVYSECRFGFTMYRFELKYVPSGLNFEPFRNNNVSVRDNYMPFRMIMCRFGKIVCRFG